LQIHCSSEDSLKRLVELLSGKELTLHTWWPAYYFKFSPVIAACCGQVAFKKLDLCESFVTNGLLVSDGKKKDAF